MKPMTDEYIRKQDAVKALDGKIIVIGHKNADAVLQYMKDISNKIKSLPPADVERVRMVAYADGYKTAKIRCGIQAEKDLREVGKMHYQRGLYDAWKACRKIVCYEIDGGYPVGHMLNLFERDDIPKILSDYTAAEAIEKIRQYERGRKEEHLWIFSEANEPSVDTTLTCSKCGYVIKIKPNETPVLNFCPQCGDNKNPKEGEA